jgi:O-antigen ligase
MDAGARLLRFCRTHDIVPVNADSNSTVATLTAGLVPLLLLSLKGWTNVTFLLLFLLALYDIYRQPQLYWPLWADRRIGWLTAALASAFIAILISQTLRWDFHPQAYDAPLRPLAGILVLLFLTARRVNFVKLFQWTCPLAVLIGAAELLVASDPYHLWGGRLSNYFVDPLSLGQYMLLLGILSAYMINLVEKDSIIAVILKLAAFIVGLTASVLTESRSAWLAIPVFFLIWIFAVARIRNVKAIAIGVVVLLVVCALAYLYVPPIHLRLDSALNDYRRYFDGGTRDTSGGLRLSLLRAAWHLFLTQPLYGFGDGGTPPLQSIPTIQPFYTELLQYALVHNGAHNELFQNMIRSGIFGIISTVLMFGVPLFLFWSAAASRIKEAFAAGVVGLGYIVGVFCFSLTTEAFALKYLVTFYALMVAALAAQIISAEQNHSLTLECDGNLACNS